MGSQAPFVDRDELAGCTWRMEKLGMCGICINLPASGTHDKLMFHGDIYCAIRNKGLRHHLCDAQPLEPRLLWEVPD